MIPALIILLSGPVNSQSQAPGWLIDKESKYPSSLYIAAMGEGKTRAEAETAAVTVVSMFFGTKTDIRKEAIRKFNETLTNNTSDFSKKTYISENSVVRSEEEFLGIRFEQPWLDSKRQIWAVLAYIDRREAAGIYESKIKTNMSAINTLIEDAGKEKEALFACGLLYKGLGIADITEELIKTASVVDSGSIQKYAPDLQQIQKLRSDYRAMRSSLTFSIMVNGPDTSGRIERKLQELLEDNSYIVTLQNPQYIVSVRYTATEEKGTSRTCSMPRIPIAWIRLLKQPPGN
jgi:hypothetical protein